MTRSIVLDVETVIDRRALAASGRARAPRDMPPPLQVLTAVALLYFERDARGCYSGFGLESVDGPESGIAGLAESGLARVHAGGGDLVTYNGSHDLNVLRFALLRARMLGGLGVSRWLEEGGGRQRDLMPEVARDGRWPRLVDVASGLGFAPSPRLRTGVLPDLYGREKAETDVMLTMLLYIHLDAERMGDAKVLRQGALAFGRFLAGHAMRRPHLSAILDSALYVDASRTLAG